MEVQDGGHQTGIIYLSHLELPASGIIQEHQHTTNELVDPKIGVQVGSFWNSGSSWN
jgi:hypothetical protein